MVKVEGLSFAYNRAAGDVLHDINFEAENGKCLAILGNNGAGKSTLIKCIDRICPARDGRVIVDGEDVHKMSGSGMAQKIAYVPQSAGAVNMTVFDTVLLGRKPYIKWDVTSEDREIAAGVIHSMGLDDYVLRKVSELSGGEAQKVMLARALAQEPKLLLLDEHTAALDPKTAAKVMELTDRIVREGQLTTLMITHNMRDAIEHGNRLIMMSEGRIVRDISGEEKKRLTVEQLIARFSAVSGKEFANDRVLLGA